MREFAKSFTSLYLAMSLFAIKQVQNVVTPRPRGQRRGPATKALDAVTNATVDQFGETLRSTFRMFDNVQRGVLGLGFNMFIPFLSSIGSASGREARREETGENEWRDDGDRKPWADRMLSATQSQLDDPVAVVTSALMWPFRGRRD
jgi:hypothetical protein